MAVIVDVAQAVMLAQTLKIDTAREVAAIEKAMASLGRKIARKLDVQVLAADIDLPAYGGACVSFVNKPGNEGRACPKKLQALDEGGEL